MSYWTEVHKMRDIESLLDTSFINDDVLKLAKQYKVESSFVGVQYTKILLHVAQIKPDEDLSYYKTEVYNRTDNWLRAWKNSRNEHMCPEYEKHKRIRG